MIFNRLPTAFYRYSSFFCLLFLAERYSKIVAVSMLQNPLRVHKNITLQLLYNRGVSWSMLSNVSTPTYHIITGIIFLICCMISAHTIKLSKKKQPITAELFVLTGSFSNLLDRLQHQAVIDFISLSYHHWHGPVFNLADCFIICGLLGMFAGNYKATKQYD